MESKKREKTALAALLALSRTPIVIALEVTTALPNKNGTSYDGTAAGNTYHYNVQGLRDMDTLADGSYWSYSYDPLRQLTRADKHLPTGETDLPSQLAGFTFDGIGNTSSGPDPSNPTFSASYGRNNQNQLTTISHAPYLSLSGEADPDATLNVTGSGPYNPASVTRQGSKFRVNYYLPGSSTNAYVYLTNVATLPAIANLPAARATNITTLFRPAGSLETLTYDEAGNLFSDARWNYTWDAYNRLTKMESKPGDPEASKRRLQFGYDAAGRRISRVTSTWANGAYQVVDSRKFVYDGWHLVGELTADNSVIRSYAWAGDRLLAIRQGNNIYIPVLDGNGNVMALVNQATRAVEAQYEYGPFGLLLKATGPMALQNPIRYSSQYQDDATGLIYYGHRYFNPATQHWISRDPIGMFGGFNLYGFVNNDPINHRDSLGLAVEPGGGLFEGFLAPIGQGIKSGFELIDNIIASIISPEPDVLPDLSQFVAVREPGFPFGYTYVSFEDDPYFRSNRGSDVLDDSLAKETFHQINDVANGAVAAVLLYTPCKALKAPGAPVVANNQTILRASMELEPSQALAEGVEVQASASSSLGGSVLSQVAAERGGWGYPRNARLSPMEGECDYGGILPEELRGNGMNVVSAREAGVVARPRHHMLPKEYRPSFEDHGFKGELDIDNFTIEMEQAQHEAIHGGGNWRLGRTSPDEYNAQIMGRIQQTEARLGRAMTTDEILGVVSDLKDYYGIEGDFVPYR